MRYRSPPGGNSDNAALRGDWVFDHHAPREARLQALAATLSEEAKVEMTFEPHEREDDVVVITSSTPAAVRSEIDIATHAGPGIGQIEVRGPLSTIFDMVAFASHRPVLDERPDALREEDRYVVTLHHTGDRQDLLPEDVAPREDAEELMTVLAEKLHFEFKIEKRKWTVWELTVK